MFEEHEEYFEIEHKVMFKTSIIGMGVVGSAIYANMNHNDLETTCYDTSNTKLETFSKYCSFDIETQIVFIAVPTPTHNNKQDDSIICQILDSLVFKRYEELIVINSTLLYKTIEKYPSLNIVYNPEFVSAKYAIQDFYEQDYVVLGGNIIDTQFLMDYWFTLFRTSHDAITFEQCTIQEAIDFKYIRNIKQAYNLLFWEFVQDKTLNSRKLSKMMKHLPVGENSQINLDGYRGYGQSDDKSKIDFSACLDKDIRAYNTDDKLLNYLISYNTDLTNK